MTDKPWHRLGPFADLPDGSPCGKTAGGRPLVIVRVGDEVFAFDDRCPHVGAPLSDGKLQRTLLTCRHHKWQFDVRTAKSVRPRGSRLRGHAVKIEDGDVYVRISS